jgi:chromosome segregation ATPase
MDDTNYINELLDIITEDKLLINDLLEDIDVFRAKETHDAEIEELSRVIDARDLIITDLREDIIALEEEHEELNNEFNHYSTVAVTKEDLIVILKNTQAKLVADLKDLIEANKELEENETTRGETIETLMDSIYDLEFEMDEKNAIIDDMHTKIDSLLGDK